MKKVEFQPVHLLFEQQVELYPDRTALIFGEEKVSYRSLNQKANKLAKRILAEGLIGEDLVGIYLPRGFEMIAAVLAVMKAGGAYLPLDPAYPQDHLKYILQDARPKIVITDKKNKTRFDQQHVKTIEVDSLDRKVENPSSSLHLPVRADQLAYCIYTSGSTGKPKGVLVEHHSLANFVHSAVKDYGTTIDDRVLQFASLNFDTSAEEIFPALVSGAALVLRTEDMLDSIPHFLQLCETWQITILDLPTAFWHELVIYLTKSEVKLPPQLRLIIIGGERVSPAHLDAWHALGIGSVRLDNTYGLTECTCVVSRCELNHKERKTFSHREVSIGKAIDGVELYVLNEKMEPVPVGTAGELFVGGECLARGYLNLPELTAARFITNPFIKDRNERLYRTGDIVQQRADGSLEYLGRSDEQIKLRGFRIEPGEIESALLKFPNVLDALVLKREDPSGNDQLVAYLVPKSGESLSAVDIKKFIASGLPKHMVPSYIRIMAEFPLSPNRKIDKGALPDPDWGHSAGQRAISKPETQAQKKLLSIWEEALNRTGIGIDDNFFDIGGHSLLAARMMTSVEIAFGQSIPLVTLLEKPTIRELGEVIANVRWKPSWRSFVQLKDNSDKTPLFLVHAIGGDILSYRRLVNRLDSLDRPVYGLRAQGLGGNTSPIHSIEEMAAFYIKEIREIQPAGPYFLGGYSFGGTVAYEMAQQLISGGAKVAFLGMFDTVILENLPRDLYPSKSDLTIDQLARIWFVIKKWLYLSLPKKTEYLQKLFAVAGGRIKAWVKQEKYVTPQDHEDRIRRASQPPAFRQVEAANNEALSAYTAQVYPGRITFFKAKQREWSELVNPEPLWKKLALGGVDEYVCEGNHNTILVEPYVQDLAWKLVKSMENL